MMRLRSQAHLLGRTWERSIDVDQLDAYVLNEQQEDCPAPWWKQPTAGAKVLATKRQPPRSRRDPVTVRRCKCNSMVITRLTRPQ